jgi:hypothetical protein
MAEGTNTPNRYLENVEKYHDAPGLYTASFTAKDAKNIEDTYKGEGDLFSGDDDIAIVEGDAIKESVVLMCGVLPKNMTYEAYKAEALAKSDKAKARHEAEVKEEEENKDRDKDKDDE